MTAVYVCSEKCKHARKNKLPKRVSILSLQYWLNVGMSGDQAKARVSKLQRERSLRCEDYWIKRGFSVDDAKKQVNKYQREASLVQWAGQTKEERQVKSPFSRKYWINNGYSESDADEIIRTNSDGTSLKFHIEKYGDELGTARYNALCSYRKTAYSLTGYIEKYGEEVGTEIWSRKYSTRVNSMKAASFFKTLLSLMPDFKIYTAVNENGEYGVRDVKRGVYYFFDFIVPELKLCVEFNGDYWHCNPKKYQADFFHTQHGLMAGEIWNRDRIKIERLYELRQFDTIVVWESDDKQESIGKIMEVVNEFRKSKNQA